MPEGGAPGGEGGGLTVEATTSQAASLEDNIAPSDDASAEAPGGASASSGEEPEAPEQGAGAATTPTAASAVPPAPEQPSPGAPHPTPARAGHQLLKTIHINLAACKYSVCESPPSGLRRCGLCRLHAAVALHPTPCASLSPPPIIYRSSAGNPANPARAVRIVARKLGWVEVGDDAPWQVCWTDTSSGTERLMRLRRSQKLNHFPGSESAAGGRFGQWEGYQPCVPLSPACSWRPPAGAAACCCG